MTRFRSKHFAILRKFYPLFMSVIIGVIGYMFAYFYTYNQQQALTINTNHITLGKVDNLYTSLRSLSIAMDAFISVDCNEAKPSLHEIMTRLPNIKSITLLKGNTPFCSTHDHLKPFDVPPLTSDSIPIEPRSFNSYLIFWNNQLYFKQIDHDKNMSLLIDIGHYQVLKDILIPRTPLQVILLKLKNHVITDQGIQNEPIRLYQSVTERSFRNYNFYVKTGYTVPLNFLSMVKYHPTPLIIVLIVAIIAYILTYWFIRNIANAYYELQSAIKNGHIKAYAQPLVYSQTGKLSGIEILARWHHPKFGLINPDTFIQVAEDTGLIIQLTQALFKEVATTLSDYADRLPDNLHIGFNISREHCKSLQLVDDCKKFLKNANNKTIILVIEITERQLIEVTDMTTKLFKELHKLNAKIALDDFGVGNSNLSYLNNFAIDYLKIDRSFVGHIGSDALSKNILDSIIEITQACNIESCAEGVETEEQALYLKEKGVTYQQGYYYLEPIAIEEFVQHHLFQECLRS